MRPIHDPTSCWIWITRTFKSGEIIPQTITDGQVPYGGGCYTQYITKWSEWTLSNKRITGWREPEPISFTKSFKDRTGTTVGRLDMQKDAPTTRDEWLISIYHGSNPLKWVMRSPSVQTKPSFSYQSFALTEIPNPWGCTSWLLMFAGTRASRLTRYQTPLIRLPPSPPYRNTRYQTLRSDMTVEVFGHRETPVHLRSKWIRLPFEIRLM